MTLYETYDRILNSIDEAFVEDAYKMLQWLAFSTRPVCIALIEYERDL